MVSAKHYILAGDIEYKGCPTSDRTEKFYSKAHHLEPSGISASRLAAVALQRKDFPRALEYL